MVYFWYMHRQRERCILKLVSLQTEQRFLCAASAAHFYFKPLACTFRHCFLGYTGKEKSDIIFKTCLNQSFLNLLGKGRVFIHEGVTPHPQCGKKEEPI